MHHRTALVLLAVVVAGCGHGDGSESSPNSTSSPVSSATTTEPASTTTAVSTSPIASTPTTLVEPTTPALDDTVTFGAPEPALLPAAPPDAIDWASVGPGWLLIDHRLVGTYVDPVALDQRGLYLVSPDDVVYGVSALPTDGSRIVAVSEDARRVLLEQFDPVCAEGCTCSGGPLSNETGQDDRAVLAQVYGYALLDLPTTTSQSILDPVAVSVCEPGVFVREVDFTIDGTGIWVSETWNTHDYRTERVRLSRVDTITGGWTTILDEPVEVDAASSPSTWAVSLVELHDGRIVVSTPTGTWLRERDGAPLLGLDVPDSCELVRAWDANHVLARCTVPPGLYPPPPEVPAEDCHASGLWLIALDGSPAQPFAVLLNDSGFLSCWAGYADAVPLGDRLALQVGGDGCSDDVVVISPAGDATTWVPPDISDPCTQRLMGVRDDAWLIGAWSETDASGAVFEVTGHGSTKIDLPSGDIIVL